MEFKCLIAVYCLQLDILFYLLDQMDLNTQLHCLNTCRLGWTQTDS